MINETKFAAFLEDVEEVVLVLEKFGRKWQEERIHENMSEEQRQKGEEAFARMTERLEVFDV